jgi:hypothetical protein
MPRPVHVVEHVMEAQVAVTGLRRAAAPLWVAALASGDWDLIADCKALSATIGIASTQLRRMAGRAETVCPDLLAAPGHGAAA